MPHGARLGIAWIWQLWWQYGCVPKDVDRSLARIDVADLRRLAVLAAEGEAVFERNPARFRPLMPAACSSEPCVRALPCTT